MWRIALFSLVAFFGSCSTPVSDNPRVGTMTYREYAAWAKQNPYRRPLFDRDPHALHALFQRALSRMQQPYILAGEDVEGLFNDHQFALFRYGDHRFAQVLSGETFETRAAVAWFLKQWLREGAFPETRRLCEVPAIKFPAIEISQRDGEAEL